MASDPWDQVLTLLETELVDVAKIDPIANSVVRGRDETFRDRRVEIHDQLITRAPIREREGDAGWNAEKYGVSVHSKVERRAISDIERGKQAKKAREHAEAILERYSKSAGLVNIDQTSTPVTNLLWTDSRITTLDLNPDEDWMTTVTELDFIIVDC